MFSFATDPDGYGLDSSIPILTILESNGHMDAIWSLRATREPSDQFTRLLACDFAEHVLPIFEKRHPNDKRPRHAIEVSRLFACGKADRDQLIAARKGADAAAAAEAAAAAFTATAAAYTAAADAAAATAAATHRIMTHTEHTRILTGISIRTLCDNGTT